MQRIYIAAAVTVLLLGRHVHGAPAIDAVAGSVSNGQVVTLSGTAFGDKVSARPLLYDNVEGGLSNGWADVNNLTVGSNDNRHARSARNAFLNFRAGVDTGNVRAQNAVYPSWYVQYWMRLGTNWDWGNTGYDETNRFLSNLKIFRLWNPGAIDENVVFAIGGWADSVIFNVEYVTGNTFNAYIGGMTNYFSKGAWHLLQFEFAENSTNHAADGVMRFWVDGALKFSSTNLVTREDFGQFKRPFIIGFDSVWGPNTGLGESDDAPNDYAMDDIYMDSSWARVELLNSSNYATATRREIQVPLSWSTTRIDVALEQGAFTNGEQAYLFVTDAAGNRSAGHPVVLGAYGPATYYVDDDAPDNSGDGLTPATAKHHIGAALALCRAAGGDTVVVMDGVYDEAADRIQHSVLPTNGTSYTTIRAQNRWGAELREPLDCSEDGAVRNYVVLDGLRFTSLAQHIFAGARWKILNCAFHGALGMGNNGSSQPGLACEYNLVEDCHVWGPGGTNAMRYKVQIYNSRKVVVRRVVARHDGSYWSEGVVNPSANFVVYSCQDVALQNCIAIDSPGPDCDEWSAGYYTADHTGNGQLLWSNIAWQGCIAMNITNTIAFRIDNGKDTGATDRYDNCIAIGGEGSAAFAAWNNYSVSSRLVYSQCSVINTGSVAYDTGLFEGGYISSVHRCLIRGTSGSALGSVNTAQYNNAYACGANNPGSNGFTTNPETNGLLYPPRIEPGSFLEAAGGGARVGADVSKAWGVSGSAWGEPGFDAVTTNALWPFPNEDQIRSDFLAFSNASDEARGFCAPEMTLTRYLWEYLGRAADVDDDALPDGWENRHFGSATNGFPLADDDLDGHNAWQEYVAGTEPTNAASIFKLESAVPSAPGGFVVQWSSASNKLYAVHRATDLGGGFAPIASNLVATPPMNSYTDAPVSPATFYSVDVR